MNFDSPAVLVVAVYVPFLLLFAWHLVLGAVGRLKAGVESSAERVAAVRERRPAPAAAHSRPRRHSGAEPAASR